VRRVASSFPSPSGGGSRASTLREPILLGLLAALSFLTRLPYFDRTFFISDSARYALALARFDVTAGRPHPPGNPLYVGIVAIASALSGDPVSGLALVSAAAGTLAVVAIYFLGRDLGGRTAGAIAALALATSPLFWFFGAVGMPATCEAVLSIALALACRRAAMNGSGRAFLAATALMALGFGLRSTFVFLVSPLWLWAALRRPRASLPAGAGIAACAFGWSYLAAELSGGWGRYSATNSRFLHEVVIQTKILAGGWAKAPGQALEIGRSLGWGLGLFILPLAAGLVWVLRRSLDPRGNEERRDLLFFALWTVPSLGFHALYDWAPRFGVFFLPPAFALAALTLARTGWGERPGQDVRRWIAIGVAAAVTLNVVAFTLVNNEGSGVQLLERNEDIGEMDAWVRAFDPARTVVAAHDSAFHGIWFLPEYEVLGLFGAFKKVPDTWTPHARARRLDFEESSGLTAGVSPWPLPAGVDRIVFYDEDLARLASGAPAPGSIAARSVPSVPGWQLGPYGAAALAVPAGSCLVWSLGAVTVKPCGEVTGS